MYYVSVGDCTVNIVDHMQQESIAHKLVVEGEHFGEIGLLYKCKRTATVVSRNYNTMARLSKANYAEVISEFPIYQKYLIKQVFCYRYRSKLFLRNVLNQIDYFYKISKGPFHSLIYSLEKQVYTAD